MVRNKNKRIFQFENDMVGLCKEKQKDYIQFSKRILIIYQLLSVCVNQLHQTKSIRFDFSFSESLHLRIFVVLFSLFCCFWFADDYQDCIIFFEKKIIHSSRIIYQFPVFLGYFGFVFFFFNIHYLCFCHCPVIMFQMKMLSVKIMTVQA